MVVDISLKKFSISSESWNLIIGHNYYSIVFLEVTNLLCSRKCFPNLNLNSHRLSVSHFFFLKVKKKCSTVKKVSSAPNSNNHTSAFPQLIKFSVLPKCFMYLSHFIHRILKRHIFTNVNIIHIFYGFINNILKWNWHFLVLLFLIASARRWRTQWLLI